MPNPWGVAGLAVFYLLLIHVSSFRSRVYYSMGRVGQFLQSVFIDVPVWVFHLPALQAILHNRFWTPFRRFIFWPAITGAIGWQISLFFDLAFLESVAVAVGCALLCILVINTRLGRDLEESATDLLVRLWVWFSVDFVPGLLHLIMDLSRRCLEAVEQMLYTVNEWLRFRTGENRMVVAAKAGLGLLWFGITYIIRFAINLLIEPQVNPIKHFPVVTVSHKVCLPMTPMLRSAIEDRFGVDRRRAWGLATGIITGIPGIFGFMVWELKENWKLYASNRPERLKPVAIGSHGETMLRLLKPGFHSGTVPKIFRKLRKAERVGNEPTVRKLQAELHHVAECLSRFIEREFQALLRQSESCAELAIVLDQVRLASNRVLVELRCQSLGDRPLVLAFDQRHGWLLAGLLETGWLPALSDGQRQTLANALVGLYKLAGVQLIRERITADLPPTMFAFDITGEGLLVWMAADPRQDAVYDLGAGPKLRPQPIHGSQPARKPVLDAAQLMYSSIPLTWQDWVDVWKKHHTSEPLPALLTARLLPVTLPAEPIHGTLPVELVQ